MLRGSLVIAILLSLASAALAKRIEMKTEDIGVTGEASDTLTRSKAVKVMTAGRKAFSRISNLLGVNSEIIFAEKAPRPFWATWSRGRNARIWIRLEAAPDTRDFGFEAYLERLADDRMCIVLPVPAGDVLSPAETAVLWREMTHAILAHMTWWTSPRWLREGLAEHLGTVGAKDDPAVVAELTKLLREQKKRDPGKLVAAITRSSFDAHGGRALAWALVRMLSVANPKYTHGLLRQGRGLLSHLVGKPGVRQAQIEGTGIVEGSLEATGATDTKLADAVTAWIEGECPTGSQFRRNKAHRILRGFKIPGAFGMKIEGRFGMARRDDPSDPNCRTTRSFRGARIAWSLPWKTTMDAWVGMRGRRSKGLDPHPERDGLNRDWRCRVWTAERRGTKKFTRQPLIVYDARQAKVGFIHVAARSPTGLTYAWRVEYPLR